MSDDQTLSLHMSRLDKHIRYLEALSKEINATEGPLDEEKKEYLLLGVNDAILTMADVLRAMRLLPDPDPNSK